MSESLSAARPEPAVPDPCSVPAPPAALAESLERLWMLDPAIDFLNHGSFGALPRRVSEAQTLRREFIESRPVERLGRRCRELLAEPREAVARFVGADPEEVAFVTNATDGANAVLRSLQLAEGDEILATDHVYNALRQTMRYVARRAGATYVEVPVPVPVRDAGDVAGRLLARVGPRTRLVIVDHVSSPTAIRFPIEQIVPAVEAQGVPVLVDGAHAPGMLPLDLSSLGCSYYAANLHKWVCAPKGCAFLFARRDRQSDLHPTVVSHFLDQGFTREFDWQGTRDITPWLCAPDALAFMDDESIGLGWSKVMDHNHRMAAWMQDLLCERWRVAPLSRPVPPPSGPSTVPASGGGRFAWLGSMATVLLPEALQPAAGRFATFEELQRTIYERHAIEVPVVEWNGRRHVRPCCQVYNRPEQYERLGEAIEALAS